MKTLVLVRHAKSTWKEKDLADIDRPLNPRGIRDAHLLSKNLSSKLKPQKIYTSPATRAFHTATIFARNLNFSFFDYHVKENLYDHSGSLELLNFFQGLPGFAEQILIFGHSPTFQVLTENLSGENLDSYPTCTVSFLEFPIETWRDIHSEKAKLEVYKPEDFR